MLIKSVCFKLPFVKRFFGLYDMLQGTLFARPHVLTATCSRALSYSVRNIELEKAGSLLKRKCLLSRTKNATLLYKLR